MTTTDLEQEAKTTGNDAHPQGSWGTLISIVLILILIVIGALYAWGKRISEDQKPSQVNVETSIPSEATP